MSSFDQTAVEHAYQNWATVYDWLTPLYLLGNENRLRREAIDFLDLRPGQVVLDFACGTGRNFPLILEKIGSTGKLVGVDYTAAMLARAREQAQRRGWKNIELIQGDVTRIDLRRKFDAAVCTLAMSVIPDYGSALERMVAHVKPGGRLAISDGKRSSRWYSRPLNWLADLVALGAAAEVKDRRPWEVLRALVGDSDYKEWAWGFFYAAGGNIQDG